MKKRCLSIALVLAMVFTMLPMGITTAFAGTCHHYYMCTECTWTSNSFTDNCPQCGAFVTSFTCDGTGTDGCPYGGQGENGHDAGGHTHVWATEWSSDGTNHWHACTADGCDGTKNNQTAHRWEQFNDEVHK